MIDGQRARAQTPSNRMRAASGSGLTGRSTTRPSATASAVTMRPAAIGKAVAHPVRLEILDLLASGEHPERLAKRLVTEANRAGGADNVSVIVIAIHESS